MTYRQVVRGAVRAAYAVERANRRRLRLEVAAAKAAQRQALLRASSDAATSYEHMLLQLTEAHRAEVPVRNWNATAALGERRPVNVDDRHERSASRDADLYRPGWFARTFGIAERRRRQLAAAIDA